MTYAAYVWSALAVFLAGLAWDLFAPLLRERALKARLRKQQLIRNHRP